MESCRCSINTSATTTKTARISASRNKHQPPELPVRPPVGSYLTGDWEGCTIATIGLLELTERPAKARSDRCILYIWKCCASDLATRRRHSWFPSRTVFKRFATGNNEIELFLERMRFGERQPAPNVRILSRIAPPDIGKRLSLGRQVPAVEAI